MGSQDRNRPYGPDPNAKFGVMQVIYVQWASSLTVREAQVRQAELEGKLTAEAAKQLLAEAPGGYQISIVSEFVEIPADVLPSVVKNSAYLLTERGKRKIPAEKVEFLARKDGLGTVINLYFPREADGAAVISPGESKVRFQCKLGNATVKTEFHLDKMIRQGQRDL